MIKIEEAFKNKKAFIPFVLAGYPNLEATEKFIIKMAEVGADLIEIGIPFSDPVAEGTVIQWFVCYQSVYRRSSTCMD